VLLQEGLGVRLDGVQEVTRCWCQYNVNSIEKVEDQVDDREDVENMHFAVFFFWPIQSCRSFFLCLGLGVAVMFLCLCFDLGRGEGMGRRCFKYEVREMRQ
jgi:hypothetical protein